MTTEAFQKPGQNCPHCGTSNRVEARYCRECAAELPGSPEFSEDAKSHSHPVNVTSRRGLLITGAGVVAVGVGGWYAWDRGILGNLFPRNTWRERQLSEIPQGFEWNGGTLLARPDGLHALVVRQKGKEAVCWSGQVSDVYDGVTLVAVVPTRGPLYTSYRNMVAGEQFWVGHGKEVSSAFDHRWLARSKNGQFVFAGQRDGKTVIYRDIDSAYKTVSHPLLYLHITENGVIVYSLLKKQADWLSQAKTEVHFGDRTWEVDGVETPLASSPDGSVLAMRRQEGNQFRIKIGNKVGPLVHKIAYYAFAPDSSDFVSVVSSDNWSLPGHESIFQRHHFTQDIFYGNWPNSGIGNLTYSQTSDLIYWDQVLNGKQFSISKHLSNQRWKQLLGMTVDASYVAVSPDGSQVAYRAMANGADHVVVDQKVSPAFTRVDHPVFSQDGKKVGFGALLGRQIWWKTMDVA